MVTTWEDIRDAQFWEKELGITPKGKVLKRWVYGTKSKKWHLVGYKDRDFMCAITQTEMKRIGKRRAKEKYLKECILR